MAPSTIAVLNGTSRVNQHIIQQALGKGDRVRAIVRSTKRFYGQTKKHDDLEAHEWSDFADLKALATILDGVDAVYVALCAPPNKMHEPSWLNAEAVHSICTVLRDGTASGSRSATKLVLLSAWATIPGVPRRGFPELILGHQFNDLRATQDFLFKQAGWLDVVFVTPGVIMDNEDSSDTKAVAAIELHDGVAVHPAPLSYARVAAAMQAAANDGNKWSGKFATPMATTPISKSIKDFKGALEVIVAAAKNRLLPAVGNALVFVVFGSVLGYVVGSRDGGAWSQRTLGINVKK